AVILRDLNKLKLAQRGAYLSIFSYIFLSLLKYYFGFVYDSAAVRADAINNMTDILASLAVLIGLKISIKPPDDNHPYGHLKSENISSLVVSFIIMAVGLQVLIENVPQIFEPAKDSPHPIVIYVSIFSGLVMVGVYFINSRLSEKTKSVSLKSAAMDNLSDGMISIGTAIGLILTQFGLSDGYREQDLVDHKEDILEVEGVIDVISIKGRYHGSSIFLDVTIIVDPTITITEAHKICDQVEQHMHNKGIMSLYVHPEPYLQNK